MTICIHACQLNDAQTLRAIGHETFYETFKDQNEPAPLQAYMEKAFHIKQIEQELTTESSMFFLALTGGEAAGYLKINTGEAQSEPMGDHALEIERIYVKNVFQKKGIGQLLMQKAVDIAIEQKKKTIWLGVWEKNEKAIAFYENMGFEKTGSHSFYMGDEEQTDFIMVRTLFP